MDKSVLAELDKFAYNKNKQIVQDEVLQPRALK